MKNRILINICAFILIILLTFLTPIIAESEEGKEYNFIKNPNIYELDGEGVIKEVNGMKIKYQKGQFENGDRFERTSYITEDGRKYQIDTIGEEEKDYKYVNSVTTINPDGTSSRDWTECIMAVCTSYIELLDKNGKRVNVGHKSVRRSDAWYKANGLEPPKDHIGTPIPKGQPKPQTDGTYAASEKVPCGGMSNIALSQWELRPGASGKITFNGHNMKYKVDSNYNLTVTGDQVVLIHSSDPKNKINHKIESVDTWVAGKANVQQGNYGGNYVTRLKNENIKLYADNSDNTKPVVEQFGGFWRVRKKMKYTANVKDLNASDMKDVKSMGQILKIIADKVTEIYKNDPRFANPITGKFDIMNVMSQDMDDIMEKVFMDEMGMTLGQMDSYSPYTNIVTLVNKIRRGDYDPDEQSHPKIYLTLYIKGTCEVPSDDQLRDEIQGYPDHDPDSGKKWCDLWEQDICPRERDGKEVKCDLDSGIDSCPGCSWEEIKRLRWSNTIKQPDPKIGPDFVGLNKGLRCDDFLNEIPGERFNFWTEIGDPLTSRPMDSKTPNQRVPLHVNSRPNVRDIWAKNPRSYRHTKEVRAWNPFVGDGDGKQLVLSGLPYTEYWTPLFDAWHSYATPIDPMLSHLQQYVNANEDAARSYVRSNFGYNGDLTVYTNAYPSPIHVRYLELKTPEWKEADTNNRFCQEQYSMKVKPGIRNIKKEKWDWYKQYTNEGVLHECVNSDKCKEWNKKCVSRGKGGYCTDWKKTTCKTYYTKVKANPVQLKPIEYLRSEIKEERMPDTPPLYSLRVKFKYRIGANMEFHALTEELGSHITPGIERKEGGIAQPGTVKSGYGVQYDTKFRVTTDYDRDKTWASYPTEWHVLRPNKDVPINFTNDSFIRELQMFDPSITYDKGKDAPTHSSSKNSTYIEELIMERQRQSISPILRKISENVGPNGIGKGEPGTPRNWIGKTNISHGIGLPNDRYVTFDGVSDPNRYYHAYWGTNGNPNVIPAYTPAPLHFIHLDYRSETNYDIGSVDTIVFRDDFKASAFNNSAIRVMGNMWEDSFVRPGHKTK